MDYIELQLGNYHNLRCKYEQKISHLVAVFITYQERHICFFNVPFLLQQHKDSCFVFLSS